MSFGTQDSSDEVMNEINMTPLVDVMLVLLIIFIITVPVMKHSVNVDLPRATNQPEDVKPETVRLSVSADGKYYWNESEVTEEELFPRLQAEAAKEPQPDLHIRGDKAVRAQSIRGRMALDGLYVPISASWFSQFRSELLTFPTGRNDDQVDVGDAELMEKPARIRRHGLEISPLRFGVERAERQR